jgi:Zn finger protein HypA/HybF involved in hydrogenase expression
MTIDKCRTCKNVFSTGKDRLYCKKSLADKDDCGEYSAIEQEPKMGWHIAHGMYEDRFWCSCGYIQIVDSNMSKWKYCPVCGSKMVEQQERSYHEST